MEKSSQYFDFTNVRDLLTILFKYKYVILIVFLIIFFLTTVIAFITPRTYEGKSIMMVKFGREFLTQPEVGSGGRSSSVGQDTIMKGEIAILTSREIKAKAINSIGLQRIYPILLEKPPANINPLDAAIIYFDKDYRVSNTSGTSLITVSFTHADPRVAAEVVNTIVDAFKDKHLEVFTSNSTPFLESQRKLFQEKLRSSESNLASFKQKYGVFSLEEQRSNLIGQKGNLDTTLKTTQIQINELEQKIAHIKGPTWVAETPAEMRTQLATLQQRERELSERYTENSRTVQSVRQDIQALKSSMKQSIEDLRQIELDKARSELVMLKARAESIRKQLGQVEGEIRSLDAHGSALQELKREASGQEENYQAYSRKLEESVIMDDMDRRKMVAISVVEKAVPAALPQRGKLSKRQMVIAGFGGGIAVGIALAFLLELLSPCMTTPISAERRLGLPVMVAVTRKE